MRNHAPDIAAMESPSRAKLAFVAIRPPVDDARGDLKVLPPHRIDDIVGTQSKLRDLLPASNVLSFRANVDAIKHRLVSVGRYALRGISHPQELFTFDPDP